jgi:autotransporter-associated beta strand protein
MKTSLLLISNKAFATCLAALVALLIQFAAPSAQAAARTWSGGNGDWQAGVQGGWNGVWANGDTGTFNGSGGTVTNKSDVATGNGALVFSANNYTLRSDGATLRTITVSNSTVTLGNGVTTAIGTNVTFARSGANTLIFGGNSKATSTLNINSGGTVTNGAAALSISQATANVNAGGTLVSDASIVVGDSADGATLNVLGGTVAAGAGALSANIILGNISSVSSTNNLKITGGSLGFAGDGNTANVHGIRVGPTSAGAGVVTGIIDLEGGSVSVVTIFENASAYNSTLNLHGGTIKAIRNHPDFIRVDNIWIKSGGAIFDSNGKSITISSNLLTDVVSTGGGLTLNDSAVAKGTLTLSGATINYTGPTLVSAGRLVVPSTSSASGALTVSANASLGMSVSGTSQWQPASLTLANPSTLEFSNVQNPGTTTAPLLPVATVGSVSGVTINVNSISGTPVAGNKYPLLGNQGGTTTGYTLGTQPPGVSGHLEGISGSTLVYAVDAYSDTWAGTAGNPTFWDIATTANWTGKALANSPVGTYANGDSVLFDDTATPASPVTVDIQTAVSPANVFFNNSTKNYSVSGASGIGGSGTLTKTGTGAAILSTSNSYSGVTTVNQGTLSITHSNALGTTAGATTISPTISGNASLTFNDATADLTIAENLNFISTSTLRARLENTSAFNHTLNGNITVDSSAAGAITEFNGNTAGSIIINGDITGSVGTGSSFAIRGATAGVGGVINGNITLTGGGLSKTDIGTWTIGATGKTYSAPILLANAGTLKMGAANYLAPSTILSLGNSSGSFGTLDLNGFSQTVGGITNGTAAGQRITNSVGSAVLTVTNATDYSPANTILQGSLGLIKQGVGKLTLSGASTYTGNTTVNGGTLELAQSMLFSNSTVSVASGAFLQLSFAGTNTVAGLVLNGLSQPGGVYNSNTSPSYLAGPGSLLVPSTVATNPTNIVAEVSGGNLNLSWPADHTGWRLETQTNSLSVGLNTNWSTWPGSTTTNAVSVPINSVDPTVFFRLVYP